MEVGLRIKLHFLLIVALQRCKRSFAVDTLKSMLETRQGEVVSCKLTKSRRELVGPSGSNAIQEELGRQGKYTFTSWDCAA